MNLIDRYMPSFDEQEVHSMVVNKEPAAVYDTVRHFRFANTALTNILFRLRGLSTNTVSLQTVLDAGFIVLDESRNEEFVLGLVGKFWTPTGCLQRMTPEQFTAFNEKGFAKAVWNFSFEKISENETRVSTETRVLCLDAASRRKFKVYWFFVGPFSRIIRREILTSIEHAVKKQVLSN